MLKAVTRLDQAAGTGHRTVVQLLEDELKRWKSPEWKDEQRPKAVILYLDDSEGQYDAGWAQAGLKMSECLSLCEIAKELFKKEMNY